MYLTLVYTSKLRLYIESILCQLTHEEVKLNEACEQTPAQRSTAEQRLFTKYSSLFDIFKYTSDQRLQQPLFSALRVALRPQ